MRIFFCYLACLVIAVRVSHAQQYLFARYTPKNGLVNNRARSLYQDSKGRLYVCTFGGLSVYDGNRFINYTTENGLATSLINQIVEMGDDSLWVIPNGSGLHSLVHGVLGNIRTADNFYPVINQLIHASDGYYYALCDEGFYRWECGRFAKIALPDSTGKEMGFNLLHGVECNGRLFLVSDPYYSYVRPGTSSMIVFDLRTRRHIVAPPTPIYFFPIVTPSGDVLVATSEGVRKFWESRLLPPPHPYERAGSIRSGYMYFDRSASLWLLSGQEAIRIDREGKASPFSSVNGLPPGDISGVLQDRENNIWFTNEVNGLIRLVSSQVELYARPMPGFSVSDVSARDNSDSVWFFDRGRRLLLMMKGDSKRLFHGSGAIPDGERILFGPRNYMIAGKSIYGIDLTAGDRFRVSLLHRDTSYIYNGACVDRRGGLVLSSEKLTVISGGKVLQAPLAYLADQPAVDRYDRVWVVTRKNELYVFAIGDSLRLLQRCSLPLPEGGTRSLAIDSGGRLWVGTRDHGLYCLGFDGLRLVSRRQITMADGLSENFMAYLFCDADNTVWACSPTGLDRIRLVNGRFSIDNVTPASDTYQRLYRVMGSVRSVHWAVTREGFMKISPAAGEKSDYIPPVLFSRVLVAGEPVAGGSGGGGSGGGGSSGGGGAAPGGGPLSLPYDRNSISFYIGMPTFSDKGRIRYSYLLEGSRNPEWSAQRFESAIDLVNLPPGEYVLRVRAQLPAGRYPERSASYSFVIRPPWWQAWWFMSAMAAVLVLMIWFSFRSYIRRRLEVQRVALEKKQAIEKERTRIATDMHDELGAGLSRIKFLSETISIKKQQQLSIEDEITGIRVYSHEMIDKMGEIVWALNEKNDSLCDLLSYARSYAAEYLMQSGIGCVVEGPGELPATFVSGEFRRNVYLTIKETLHNIVKHSKASCVWLRIETGRNLVITIQDDGVGFDRAQVRPFSNGLGNMRQRMKDVGGELVILSGVGGAVHAGAGTRGGTTVRIVVPLPA